MTNLRVFIAFSAAIAFFLAMAASLCHEVREMKSIVNWLEDICERRY